MGAHRLVAHRDHDDGRSTAASDHRSRAIDRGYGRVAAIPQGGRSRQGVPPGVRRRHRQLNRVTNRGRRVRRGRDSDPSHVGDAQRVRFELGLERVGVRENRHQTRSRRNDAGTPPPRIADQALRPTGLWLSPAWVPLPVLVYSIRSQSGTLSSPAISPSPSVLGSSAPFSAPTKTTQLRPGRVR